MNYSNNSNNSYMYKPKNELRPDATICAVLCAILTAAVICSLFMLNSFAAVSERSEGDMGLMDVLAGRAESITAMALGDTVDYKRSFFIPESTVVCPAPDQSLYGSAISADEIKAVISGSDLARGVPMVWNENIEYHKDTPAQYYSDDSIFTLCWKECDGEHIINFAEIFISDGSQFRRFLCENTFGSNNQKYATTMAESVNAVLAMNGDFYANRQAGVLVYGGKVYRNNPQFLDQCFINADGDMIFKRQGEIGDDQSFQKFVDDNGIRFSLSFGPILVEDHTAITRIGSYNLGEVDETYARAAIGMMGPRHYLLSTVEGAYKPYVGVTILEMAKIMGDRGCEKAYTIDGGQTAVLILNNKLYNRVVYNAERQMSDIIYFATAVSD